VLVSGISTGVSWQHIQKNYMKDKEQTKEEIVPISQLSKQLGITTRTLRYWEEVGIIESVERAEGANRGYTPYIVRRIKFIIKLKELGLSIQQFQELYKVYGDARRTDIMVPKLIAILDNHINQIDSKIERLASLRNDIVEYREKMTAKLDAVTSSDDQNL
jgi:MerR family transcriptional regulator, repressor of the yfmOP operon